MEFQMIERNRKLKMNETFKYVYQKRGIVGFYQGLIPTIFREVITI
jgi:hypothetical protein